MLLKGIFQLCNTTLSVSINRNSEYELINKIEGSNRTDIERTNQNAKNGILEVENLINI